MEKPPAFQFYPKDFLSDEYVACMTSEQRGALITLLCHCWLEGSLPNDDRMLAKLSNCGRRWGHIRDSVMRLFYLNEANRYAHKRLDLERQKQKEYREMKSKSGTEGARARWGKIDGTAISSPIANDSSSSSVSSLQSSTPTAVVVATTTDKNKKNTPSSRESLNEVYAFYQANFVKDGFVPPIVKKELHQLFAGYGYKKLMWALKVAVSERGKTNLGYVKAILGNEHGTTPKKNQLLEETAEKLIQNAEWLSKNKGYDLQELKNLARRDALLVIRNNPQKNTV